MNLNRLATAYRPNTFDEVVGHTLSMRALQGMVATKDLPPGLLFSGHSGSGKTTVARLVASALDADVIEVDAASHGGVADVRKLNESLRYSSGHEHKILVIDEAHSLTRDAFNALLKSLEEAADGVLYILVTTDPQKIPKTVRTRLVEFEFKPLTPVEIMTRMVQVIKAEEVHPQPELIRHIATHSDGSVRQALNSLGLVLSAGINTVDEFLELNSERDHSAVILQAMTNGDIEDVYQKIDHALLSVSNASVLVDQLVRSLRDILVIRGTKGDAGILVDAELKKELSRKILPERTFAMLRILWDLKTQVKSRGDRKQDVELACALLYDVVNR